MEQLFSFALQSALMKFRENTFEFIGLFLSVLLFVYLALRAYYIPFVHDESATFFYYIQSGIFWPPYAHPDANNHILNSALAALSFRWFGSSEFALRLPNLLSFIVFLIYLYHISLNLKNIYLRWLFILSLSLAHNFIEFFALSRGYGLSMAFLTGALYYLIRALRQNKTLDYLLSLIFLSLAIFANMTLINTALIFVGIMAVRLLYQAKSKNIWGALFLLIFILGPVLFLVKVGLSYKEQGLLYYGELSGFWQVTLRTLVLLLTGSENHFIEWTAAIMFGLILMLSVLLLRKNSLIRFITTPANVFVLLLLGNIAAIFALRYLFTVNFPEDRVGLYLFPFFIGSLIFLLDQSEFNSKYKLLLAAPLIYFPIHFFWVMNINNSSLWHEDHIPKRYMTEVLQNSSSDNYPPIVGGYTLRRLCWAFDNYRMGGTQNQIQSASYPELISDFQVVVTDKYPLWENYYTKLDYDPVSKLSLLKRKRSVSKTEILSYHNDTPIHTKDTYINIFKGNIDTLKGTSLIVNARFQFNSPIKAPIIRLVSSVNDSNGTDLRYEYIQFNWKKDNWEHSLFSGSIIIKDIPANASKLKVYIWNKRNNSIELSDIDLEILKVQIENM